MTDGHHKVGFTSAVLLIIGNVIGAGTFAVSGLMLSRVGHPVLVLFIWLIAGVVMLCGAVCYGALARQMPESGGEYLFISRIFHPMLGCLAGWVSLLVGFSAPIAVCAFALGEYTRHWFIFSGLADSRAIGTVFVVLFAIMHCFGRYQGLMIQNLIISFKLVLIGAFIYLISDQIAMKQLNVSSLSSPADWNIDGLSTCFIWAFFAYSGWNSVIYVASEIKASQQNLMKVTMTGSCLVLLIYLVLNYAILGQEHVYDILGQVDYLLLIAEHSSSPWAVVIAAIIVNLALLSSLSALIMMGPRVYAKMADDGYLPEFLQTKSGNYHNAIIFQGIVVLLILWYGSFEFMLTSIGYLLGICCVMTVIGLVRLKLKDENINVLFWPYAPAIFIASVTFCVIYHVYMHPIHSLTGLVMVLPGFLFWFLGKNTKANVVKEKVTSSGTLTNTPRRNR
ncbi:amino acid permease [Endozoicomonas sp. ISHI1]|uniref:APC family permease n=1 Tax=Endozoicomonas sp. ISHI1 TaxID=2825882 RepID=UPI002147E1D6